MNRLDRCFQRKALIAYVTAGFPSMAAMNKIVGDLEEAGADAVELGIPFSDPIADGPTTQWSSQKSLKKGTSLRRVLNWVKVFRKKSQLPIILMSYLNPIHKMGYGVFAKQAQASGVDGLIVPDLIPEESGNLRDVLNRARVRLIFLVAPTTPPKRQAFIARRTRGFLYAVSVTGVTGARRQLPADVVQFVRNLKRVSQGPVALGFGISSPAQAAVFAPHVDGVIVGSAFIEKIREGKSVAPLAASLRRALDQAEVISRGKGKTYARG